MAASSQHSFVSAHYGLRAQDYVASASHSTGDDLDQIETILRGQTSARVLDLGCGGGHVSYRAALHVAEVVACDVTREMLEAVARTASERGLGNLRTQHAAAELLPFCDAEFDFVLCRFTAHHWHNLEAGLREARRVLRPGGQAVLIDTIAPAVAVLDTYLQAIELLRDASHVRNYSLAEWVGSLTRSGFNLQGTTFRRLHLEFHAWVARTRTPAAHAAAVRSLQSGAPESVQRHFCICEDGSFDLDTATFVLSAPSATGGERR